MFKMRPGAALPLLCVLLSPLLLDCTTKCQMGNPNDYTEGQCPVKLTLVPSQDCRRIYCVSVRVWITAQDFSKSPKVDILSPTRQTLRPVLRRGRKGGAGKHGAGRRVQCDVTQQASNSSSAVWELLQECVEAEVRTTVSVTYSTHTNRTGCSASYTVGCPVPEFGLFVNHSSKSISVTVGDSHNVSARWCYRKQEATEGLCTGGSPRITIDPSRSPSVVLSVPHLLPCVCVEVYYTHTDCRRNRKCPLLNSSLIDVSDVLRSSEVVPYESSLNWSSVCPTIDFNVSASLCWRQQLHLCIPVLNSTLQKKHGATVVFNTSAVDKHPQMCVQFSVGGSHNISCPFTAAQSSWEVSVRPGTQSWLVYLTSSALANFSTQLCILTVDRTCTPTGPAHSVTVEGSTMETRISVPHHLLVEKPCVQVWQSHPALQGRRILCPHYMHDRRGLYALAALVFVVVVALVSIFIHRVTKRGAAGWLYIQKPLLLVCSSDQSAHISAVCALASVLQGELGATVHTALWAQCSQGQTGTGAGVADLGPLPWLYGQWEAICKAQGKVLIIWSPEAKKTYEKWRKERADMDKSERQKGDREAEERHEKMREEVEEDVTLNGRRPGKCNPKKAAGKQDCVKLCDDAKDWYPQKEPSTVIEPVFTAALACLEGALQEHKGQGVAIVYFQGLGHSRDIPKVFKGVSRYCLPQNFSGLIQELGETRRRTEPGKLRWYCWSRLVSKVLSMWLARQLAQRLQTLLPQTQGDRMMSSSSSMMRLTSDKTQSRLRLPLAAESGTAQEQELLHASPWRREKL